MTLSILICDDSNIARKQLKRVLPQSWNESAQLVKNGEEALDVLRSEHVDVLFLDLTMPILNGFDVLTTMKSEGLNIKTIVIAADIQAEARKRVEAAGAIDFIKKPVSAETLNEVLNKHNLL